LALTFKGNKIIVKTDKDIAELESKMAQIQMQYEPFTIFALTTIINEEIVDKIQDKMRSNGVSQKVIDNTFLDNNIIITSNKVLFSIKSTYADPDSGFAVAVMIEEGREAYTINAPEPTADRPRPHLTPIIGGVKHFLKKVDIPVFPAQRNIEKTIQQKTKIVQKRLKIETAKWIRKTLRS